MHARLASATELLLKQVAAIRPSFLISLEFLGTEWFAFIWGVESDVFMEKADEENEMLDMKQLDQIHLVNSKSRIKTQDTWK